MNLIQTIKHEELPEPNNINAKRAKVFAHNSELVTDQSTIKAMNSEWVNYDIKEARKASTDVYGNEYT